MTTYTYLNKSVPGHKAVFETPLDPEIFDNIGSTEHDYYAGQWVPLSAEQVAFMDSHPGASIAEILNMELTPPPPRSLESARAQKLAEIDAYDVSPEVNGFILGGTCMWLDKATRVGLANSIAIEAEAGREITNLWFDDKRYELLITVAKQMLATVELYALECYNVTASHRYAVSQLTTIEEIDAYDYRTGYPAQLNFDSITTIDNPCSDDE